MATKPPPPPRKPSDKGEPPKLEQNRSNLDTPQLGELANLNFKVPAEFKRDFKIAAAQKGITQVDLLQEIFQFWSQHQS
ncbi:hypothetical protein [Phormidesmis priestleyi]|uniref:hypothetical protein n=1 Tax=Phormidesmis priestleyi TaxID=268141 RepID=UPI00083AF524|nr:hypothetical protein [Phormidesmis priestleyi]